MRIFISIGLSLFVLGGLPISVSGAEEEDTPSVIETLFAHEEERDRLMEVDRQFSADAQELGVAGAFDRYMLDDARYLANGGEVAKGRHAILEILANFPDGATMRWQPEEAFLAASHDLGVTWGRYVYEAPSDDGETIVGHGKYTTVWKRDAAGDWKFVLDVGNSNPPPAD
jgi:ketosteroid isomerase-like protein